MAKSKRDPSELPAKGLTHNPFAALRGSSAEPAPAKAAAEEPAAAEDRTQPSGPSILRVRREKKGRRGKTVTRVKAGAPGSLDWSDLAGRLKRALGCGATVEGDAIYLQGDLTQRAAAWLEQHLGVECRIEN